MNDKILNIILSMSKSEITDFNDNFLHYMGKFEIELYKDFFDNHELYKIRARLANSKKVLEILTLFKDNLKDIKHNINSERPLQNHLTEAINTIEKKRKGTYEDGIFIENSISTGFIELNTITGDLQKGGLTLI